MRGKPNEQPSMLALISINDYVPLNHPIRLVKKLADHALKQMSQEFEALYARYGRPSIPPETLLKSQLLIVLYSLRSERQFCEQLQYNLMFRWFLDMDMIDRPFDASSFSKNRDRVLAESVAQKFFLEVVTVAEVRNLVSRDHFSVDGSLIEAWASLKSFCPKDDHEKQSIDNEIGSLDGSSPPEKPVQKPNDTVIDHDLDYNSHGRNPSINFRGEKRSNATHESTTDPEAKLLRKGLGKEAKLCFRADVLMENRNGLLVDFQLNNALEKTEREAALEMLAERPGRHTITVAADRGYDTHAFVAGCRDHQIVPHVAQNHARRGGSAIDGRTTRHASYVVSQRVRKRIEEIFGWMKTVGGYRKSRFKGRTRTASYGFFAAVMYNLWRIALMEAKQA